MNDRFPTVPIGSMAQKVVAPLTDCTEGNARDGQWPLRVVPLVNLARKVVATETDASAMVGLSLTVDVTGEQSVDTTRDRLLNLLQAISTYEQTLGGSGLEITVETLGVGQLALRIVPLLQAGSTERLRSLAQVIEAAIPELVPASASNQQRWRLTLLGVG